jgi:hypothetical protein
LDCGVDPQCCLISKARVSIAKLFEATLSENSSNSFRFSFPAAKFLSWINNSSGNSSAACPLTSSVSAKQNLRIAAIDRLSKLRFLSVAIWPHYITRTIEAFFAKFSFGRIIFLSPQGSRKRAKQRTYGVPVHRLISGRLMRRYTSVRDTCYFGDTYSALATVPCSKSACCSQMAWQSSHWSSMDGSSSLMYWIVRIRIFSRAAAASRPILAG